MLHALSRLKAEALLQLTAVGKATGLLSLGVCCGLCGCRALSPRGYTKDLSTAREFSLRGADALEQRKFADAEMLFSEALKQSPHDERAQWGFAEVLWERGERGLATKHMAQAAELSGANPDLLVRLGQMYLEQKDYSSALHQADLALRSSRNNATAWALKGDVLRATDDKPQSLDCYHRALIYRPDWPDVQVTVAELYQKQQRPERALATLDRLCDHRSASQIPLRASVLRGKALASLGQQAEARTCLRQAAQRVGPDQSDLLFEIATTQFELGDLVEARLCLGRSLEQRPDNPLAAKLQNDLDESFARLSATNMPDMPANWNR